MKKGNLIILLLSIFSVLLVISIIFTSRIKEQQEVHSIIGEADGPTSILISNGGSIYPLLLYFIVFIISIILIIFYRKKNH